MIFPGPKNGPKVIASRPFLTILAKILIIKILAKMVKNGREAMILSRFSDPRNREISRLRGGEISPISRTRVGATPRPHLVRDMRP